MDMDENMMIVLGVTAFSMAVGDRVLPLPFV